MTFATYMNRFPTGDDAWFAEQSYWLDKEGTIRSEFFRGIAGWENGLLVSHKLFLAFGAILIDIFGYNLPTLKFSGLIFFFFLIIELIAYISIREKYFYHHYLIVILILVFCNRLLIKMSFENRPEMMVAAFGFGSFILLNFKRDNNLFVFLSGFLAGLAFLTHLNGVIYIIAGVITLFSQSSKKATVFYFLIAATLTSCMYMIDILIRDNGFVVWWYQFRNDPAAQASFNLNQKLLQLVTYPRMFFQSPEQLSLSLLLVYFLWMRRKSLAMLPSFLIGYSITIVLAFWLISKANAGMYLVLFIPFMLVTIYEVYKPNPIFPSSLKWLIATYFIIGIYGAGQLIYKNQKLGSLPDTYHALSQNLPKSQVGLVPLTFFFNEYDQFQRLLTHENYKLYCHKQNMNWKGLGIWAKSNKVNFIVMDYQFNPEIFFPPKSVTKIPFYERQYFDGRFAIFYMTSQN